MRGVIPPPQVPITDQSFRMTPDWYEAIYSVLKRGNGNLNVSSTGIVVCTDAATGTAVARSLVAGTGLAISNADGTAGNPSYSLVNTAVGAGSYGDTTHVGTFTVDAQGRLTAAGSAVIAFPVASVFGRTGAVVAVDADYNFAKIGAGTATNDNAGAGRVGEYSESVIASGSAVGLTTGTPANVTSISLTAGDWDVSGNTTFTGGATTLAMELNGGISTTSATLPTSGTVGRGQNSYGTAGVAIFAQNNVALNFGQVRLSLAGTTTVYLVAQASFSTSTCSAYGHIAARRVR